MSGVYSHLVRRGVQVVAAQSQNQNLRFDNLQQEPKQPDNGINKIQPAECLALLFTVVAFGVLYASIKYTLGEVMSSLAMIEQPDVTVSIAVSDDPDAPLEKDAQIEVIQEKPITASIRKTVRHLIRVGGVTARWRGLSASIMYHLGHGFVGHFLGGILAFFWGHGPIGFMISSIMASVLLARIHMTWTHVMISAPSPLPWFKRIPRGRFYFKTLALPSFVFALAQTLLVVLPVLVFLSFGVVPTRAEEVNAQWEACRVLSSTATAGLIAISVVLPASVTLTRVEASLLPDDQETIVKFDRTLGGAASSAISLGSANVRKLFIDAWRTFDRTSRIRLIKFYLKMFMIQFMIIVSFFVVIGVQLAAIGQERLINQARIVILQAQLNGSRA